jgi:pimeloyl-ACP methyl ester carboxylesterase
MSAGTDFVAVAGFRLRLRRIDGGTPGAPLLVFLHQGLGTIGMWGDVPDALCHAAGCPGLIYERPGYGGSDPRPAPWPDDVFEHEAEIVLPALLDALAIERPVVIGHSDGATIALLFAAAFRERTRAVITEGAHVVRDELTLAGVADLVRAWHGGDLRTELEPHHGAGAAALFAAWSATWLAPARGTWSITARLPRITCPVLAIQGADDEYGRPAQLDAITDGVGGPAERLLVPNCGHDPHDQARDLVLERMTAFLHALRSA